jgi:NhaA family Na+:H+ antiporter
MFGRAAAAGASEIIDNVLNAPRFFITEFLRTESASGFILIAAALIGLAWANSPLDRWYEEFLHVYLGVTIGPAEFKLSAHHWINDGLMALFFLVVGLEIKRELLVGELSSVRSAALPAIAAIGGMIVPALICVAFVRHDPASLRGWAVPAATDIAFALAALSLLGSAVPSSLKIFLTALAVIDDLGAILIIALFYTRNLNLNALYLAFVCLVVLIVLNRARVGLLTPYLATGAVMWFFVLQSGVHATIAGVLLALTIPLESRTNDSPLRDLEHRLHPYVAWGIIPLFGLANAGVSFAGLTPAVLLEPLPLGIALGLLLGKQVGIFAFTKAAVVARLGELPAGMTGGMLWGLSLLAGIGFTMSLFIGGLAFENNELLLTETKVGVFAGSIVAALAGYLVLRFQKPQRA